MSAWRERVEIAGGRAVLYLGDNREVWPALGVRPDALISDPPYGMRAGTDSTRFSGGAAAHRMGRKEGRTWPAVHGDDEEFDARPWATAGDVVVLWGLNHFPRHLPPGAALIWLKRADAAFGSFLSDGEIAWLSRGRGVYAFRDFSGHREAVNGERAHPTQKPVALMEWCLQRAKVEPAALVADPFMGSGTTGVACMRRGCRFIGIEIDDGYFRTACRRIGEAARQPDLLIPETAA